SLSMSSDELEAAAMRTMTKARPVRVAGSIAFLGMAITVLSAAPAPDEPATRMSRAAHPKGDAAMELEVMTAARNGVAMEPAPKSPHIAAAIERLRLE